MDTRAERIGLSCRLGDISSASTMFPVSKTLRRILKVRVGPLLKADSPGIHIELTVDGLLWPEQKEGCHKAIHSKKDNYIRFKVGMPKAVYRSGFSAIETFFEDAFAAVTQKLKSKYRGLYEEHELNAICSAFEEAVEDLKQSSLTPWSGSIGDSF